MAFFQRDKLNTDREFMEFNGILIIKIIDCPYNKLLMNLSTLPTKFSLAQPAHEAISVTIQQSQVAIKTIIAF